MTAVVMNRRGLIEGSPGVIDEQPSSTIEASLVLRQAGLEDAYRWGGPIAREVLDSVPLQFDRKYVVVDTKVTFLLPGQIPAVPGWHTDGVPRGEECDPSGSGAPNLQAQVVGKITAPRYHLLEVEGLESGPDSFTQFLRQRVELDLPHGAEGNLYEEMSKQVDALVEGGKVSLHTVAARRWYSWDWWSVHRATPAQRRGWRYLIRVTESDHVKPRAGLAEFLRTGSTVYTPVEFGW